MNLADLNDFATRIQTDPRNIKIQACLSTEEYDEETTQFRVYLEFPWAGTKEELEPLIQMPFTYFRLYRGEARIDLGETDE